MTVYTLDDVHDDAKFNVEQVQLQFDLHRQLLQLLVQNNVMVLVLLRTIHRIDLTNPSVVKLVELPKTADGAQATDPHALAIVAAWLHWSGDHLVVRTNHKQYFYLHSTYAQFKLLPRLLGLDVHTIAFYRAEAGHKDVLVTGEFLVGTADGAIFVSLIKSHDVKFHDSKRDDRYLKSVRSAPLPLSRLEGLVYLDSTAMAVIDGELHQWSIGDNLYNDVVKGFKQPAIRRGLSRPAHLASNGRQYVCISGGDNTVTSNDEELILSQLTHITSDEPTELLALCNGIVLTSHHILALSGPRNDALVAVVKLSKGNAQSIEIPHRVLGITADYVAGTYWLYTSSSIYEIVISNETAAVWYNYYQMGKFEEALSCLQQQEAEHTVDNLAFKMDLVHIKQGYALLQQGGFGIDFQEGNIKRHLFELQIRGVKTLARLSEPFEKVCLMLMTIQQGDQAETQTYGSGSIVYDWLLVEYLQVKLKRAKADKSTVRVVVLSSWIVEVMVRMVYRAPEGPGGDEYIFDRPTLDKLLEGFLSDNYKILDAPTIYQIISGFNYTSKLIFYAELILDFEFILNHYIDLEDWSNLLRIVIKMYTMSDESLMEVIYKKATVLLVNAPRETVNTWLKLPVLDYERLLPSVLTYAKSATQSSPVLPIAANELIRFLQTVIFEKGLNSATISNYYLSLLLSYPVDRQQASHWVTRLLNKIHERASFSGPAAYDANFILRQCLQYQHLNPAILILIQDLRLFDQALTLALDNDLVDLAQLVLTRYDDYLFNRDENDQLYVAHGASDIDEDMRFVGKIKLEEESFSSRKTLWMEFAKYLIDNVCSGTTVSFLDEIQVSDEPAATTHTASTKSPGENGSVTSLIHEMSGTVDADSTPHIEQAQVRKLVKYLLSASYTPQTNSSVLSLKDILPLFPQSIMINNFKPEIIHALNQYNLKMNQLSRDMQELLQISANLKTQIKESQTQSAKGRIYTIIEPGEPCALCTDLLVGKVFVCFPNCSHGFHKDCLVKFYLKVKGEYKFKKVFQAFKRQPSPANKSEVDNLLLKECVLCNESSINRLDDNLIDPEEDSAQIEAWELGSTAQT